MSSLPTPRLNKLAQLSWGERRLLFQSLLLLPLIHVGLLLVGYYRLHTLMEKLTPLKSTRRAAPDVEVVGQARNIARMVSIAARYGLYKATCLRKSLLLWGLLHRQGLQSIICFGVRRHADQLEAHAWVEMQGIVINDGLDVRERYQILTEGFPASQNGL